MNANLQGDNIRNTAAAANLVARCQFSGMTPLGTQMHERILRPLVEGPIANRSMQKPVLVITITDGEPTSEPESKIVKVIKSIKQFAAKSQYGSGAVAFEFAQVRYTFLCCSMCGYILDSQDNIHICYISKTMFIGTLNHIAIVLTWNFACRWVRTQMLRRSWADWTMIVMWVVWLMQLHTLSWRLRSIRGVVLC